MSLIAITARRADGTFVAVVNGYPYHVIPGDPLYPHAVESGANAPLDPMTPLIAAPTLEQQRAGMILSRSQFARQAALAGKMTATEARAWAGAGSDTALGTAALALVPEGTARDLAAIVFASATTIDRLNPFMPALQAVAGWTDEQVDEFFRAGMLL